MWALMFLLSPFHMGLSRDFLEESFGWNFSVSLTQTFSAFMAVVKAEEMNFSQLYPQAKLPGRKMLVLSVVKQVSASRLNLLLLQFLRGLKPLECIFTEYQVHA